jgi:hypothetical protein
MIMNTRYHLEYLLLRWENLEICLLALGVTITCHVTAVARGEKGTRTSGVHMRTYIIYMHTYKYTYIHTFIHIDIYACIHVHKYI